MPKKMIIKGVGQFMAKKVSPDGKGVEVVTLGTLQNLRIDFNVEIDDIFGGDGLFPIDTLVRSKSIEITATDAKFDLDAVRLMMGSSIREQESNESLWVMGEQRILVPDTLGAMNVASATVEFGDTLFGDGNFAVRLKDANKILKRVPFNELVPPGVDEFMYDSVSKKLILHEDHAHSDIVFNYQRTDNGVDVVDILAEEVPFPVHVVHHGSFLQKDGTYAGIETELYSCIANGQFSIDAQRATASASTVTLRIVDPERADGKLGTIKRYTSTKRV